MRVQTVGDAEMFFNFVFEKQMVSSNLKDFFFCLCLRLTHTNRSTVKGVSSSCSIFFCQKDSDKPSICGFT